MKGFPNQVADLRILASALKTMIDLQAEGKNPRDDDVFGEALIRREILRTDRHNTPVDDYLIQQRAKRPADQGLRTRPRDLRRLFRVMGLIDDTDLGITVSNPTVTVAIPSVIVRAPGLSGTRAPL
jgi:hypothetical protein